MKKIFEWIKAKLNIRFVVHSFLVKKINRAWEKGLQNAKNAARGWL